MAQTQAAPQESHPPSIRRSAGGPEGLAQEVTVRSHGRSVKGTRRDTNRDQFLVADVGRSLLVRQTSLSREDHARILGRCQGQLLAVADGVSRNPAGEVASSVAVDVLARYVVGVMPWFVRLGARGDHDPEEGLAAVIERCQPRAQTASAAEPDHTGVGVALTMAYVVWPRAWVVHIGDSRGYLLRRGHLGRITRDRATAQQLQGEDVLDLGKAGTSTWKNVLRNANGGAGPTDPDVYRLDLEAGDTLLLCTNGLTEVLTDEELARALARDASPEGLACRLVDKARARGAHDDATALVTRLE